MSKYMKNHEQLAAHPFMEKNFSWIKPIIDKFVPIMMKRIRETGEIRNKGKTVLEISENYHIAIFQRASTLINTVERLKISLLYIEKFPSPRTYKKKGISQFSWLEYHYSYFVVTYHSLFDIALILTNTVFQLGILEKDCKPSIIKDNLWVKQTNVRATLVALDKITSTYGEKRNLFIHRGEMPDVKTITESDFIDLLNLFSTVDQHSKPIVPIDLIDNGYMYVSEKIIIELKKDVEKAQKAVSRFFDSLLPIYNEKAQ
jgi:hypothetical protein